MNKTFPVACLQLWSSLVFAAFSLGTMLRLFGRAKPAAEAPPPPDVAAHTSAMNARVPEMDKKIADLDVQLLKLKQQIVAARLPSQQNALKSQAMTLLKRKRMYEQQRGSVTQQVFNLDQSASGAVLRGAVLPERRHCSRLPARVRVHAERSHAAACASVCACALLRLPLSPSSQWPLRWSRSRARRSSSRSCST